MKKNKYYFTYDEERKKEFVNQLIKLATNVSLTTSTANSLALDISLALKEVNDHHFIEKALSFLNDVNKNIIKVNNKSRNNVNEYINNLLKTKRKAYKNTYNLPSFSININEMTFRGKSAITGAKYYTTEDGQPIITTSVYAQENAFKNGDILESIESGQRFILADIRLYSYEKYEDDDPIKYQLYDIVLSPLKYYEFTHSETLVKINK